MLHFGGRSMAGKAGFPTWAACAFCYLPLSVLWSRRAVSYDLDPCFLFCVNLLLDLNNGFVLSRNLAGVFNSLRHLSTTTNILSDPRQIQEEAVRAVRLQQHWFAPISIFCPCTVNICKASEDFQISLFSFLPRASRSSYLRFPPSSSSFNLPLSRFLMRCRFFWGEIFTTIFYIDIRAGPFFPILRRFLTAALKGKRSHLVTSYCSWQK